ncbi:hypothetical protein [Rummeliibacillus suwonensis]|uniref:hypothetical protein n=1 Tax=Rummeliibacillus suwonensis TaxID=1306154 RepID=UPI00289C4716|nr:hypothetical protein [Rummeliibacillus suwonensis]
MSLTIDLSYADAKFIEWLNEEKSPYPLLMVDPDLLERSPTLVKVIKAKNIPIGLLGRNSDFYEVNPSQLEKDISTFNSIMKQSPLWFRTRDYVFLPDVTKMLWKEQINMLAASKILSDSKDLKLSKGDIISIPYHQEERLPLKEIDRLIQNNSFQPIEETIFGYSVKTKKTP